ncbi:MAG: TolC family protein [Chitinophagales bacterium]
MMKWHIEILLAFSLLIAASAFGQNEPPLLKVEDAIKIALENNYDILVVKNNAEIARLNNTPGNAGMLPSISAQVADNFSYNGLNQRLSSGSDVAVNGVQGNALTAGVVLNWTVFDGARMFLEKKRLSKIQDIGDLQFRDQVQSTISDVVASYYSIVSYKQQSVSLREAIRYNEDRLNLARNKFDIGVSAKTDLLQAQVDANTRKSDLLQLELNIENAKHRLNELMSRAPNTTFDVIDTVIIATPTSLGEAVARAQDQNLQLQVLRRQFEVARLNKAEFNSQRWPRITLNGGYYFSRANNSAGFQILNQTYGPQVGFSAVMPLFNGLNINRQVKVAAVEMRSADIRINSWSLSINRQLFDAYREFSTLNEQRKLAEQSVQLSRENLFIATERFRLGGTNTLEVRQAQLSFEEVSYRYFQVLYNLKLNETRVKLLLSAL